MKKKVLFLCTGNSARSQMAEGLLRHLGGGDFEPFSAGTYPVGLNPGAVKAMDRIGVDITAQRSKHVNQFARDTFDYVITVCDRAKESCPLPPSAGTVLHWSFDDPAAAQGTEGERDEVFARVRNEIEQQITKFLKDHSGEPRGGQGRNT